MYRLMIKPLSTNECFQGRRFKTKNYLLYERLLLYSLSSDVVIPKGKLQVYYRFGLSNKLADADNCVKQFQDVLQKKYGFNDKQIYKMVIEKTDVIKGEEFIDFLITSLTT